MAHFGANILYERTFSMEQTRKGLTTPEMISEMKQELSQVSKPENVSKLRRKRIIKVLSNSLFAILLLSLLFILYQVISVKRNGNVPSILGYRLYNIETESMFPTFPVGTIILSRTPSNKDALKAGDVVTFINLEGDRVTHRIVRVSETTEGKVAYRTKGDNPINSIDKDLLTSDRVESVFILKVPLF